ncbi:prolipoprotein diacylglyceryl transferase [Myroides odoratus]|uniref:Phosphatidylglycerol--prolipoprotein diacylglyceryl transferase n=1 Tax=Myroides odoratus TaxID=256 RepID=A0A9Q6ZA94_MYROD|nr:prolipoprotein diacylglyceryl transferase [Myroides odoratus]EHQ41145.1 Prolipoprotein diacylglyceryl transferase [Myroides odoratus DSM 2801]EKB08483.1 prolipoprotein diacylglyceryl transferase [Myroides odoratus CIP 103059]QQT98595.1 prolipoprotein diacylglyceryl transferase [Myroides odoratus]WQD59231.1 prolipoprotein diacylglyceryl transferase [Myroides odoratus]STZ32181.1 Prolipoprotein diacylglyceryl transferase [Myroides odoratus]
MSISLATWNVDPEIFRIGDFAVRYYGVLFAIGMILSYQFMKRIFKREQIGIQYLDKLLIYIVVGTVVGARLGHCLFYDFAYYSQHPLEIILPIAKVDGSYHFVGFMGLASHGGAIGVLLSLALFCKRYKTNLLQLLDRLVIAIPITGAFIRFGNFMNSEIYGKPTDSIFGIVFLRDDTISRHPTQLYEAFAYLAVTILLYVLYQKKYSGYKGLLFGLFLILMFTARFVLEYFKENQVAFEDEMALNMGQILSIPFMIVGLGLVIWSLRKPKEESNLRIVDPKGIQDKAEDTEADATQDKTQI